MKVNCNCQFIGLAICMCVRPKVIVLIMGVKDWPSYKGLS